MPNTPLDSLRAVAIALAPRSHVPYSHAPEGVALLLDDGAVVPGVRLDSAAFPLTIPAVTAAFSVAQVVAPGRRIVAAATSRDVLGPEAEPLVSDLGLAAVDDRPWALRLPDVALPLVGAVAAPTLDASMDDVPAPDAPVSPDDGVALARRVAERARVPASAFPVGCAGRLPDGRFVGGANVEVGDWTRGLCAERTLVALVRAYGLPAPDVLYLACLKAACTPCGGCRQVLAEHLPDVPLWMDWRGGPPEATTPAALLPGGFAGDGL